MCMHIILAFEVSGSWNSIRRSSATTTSRSLSIMGTAASNPARRSFTVANSSGMDGLPVRPAVVRVSIGAGESGNDLVEVLHGLGAALEELDAVHQGTQPSGVIHAGADHGQHLDG